MGRPGDFRAELHRLRDVLTGDQPASVGRDNMLWSERVRASVAKEAIRCNGRVLYRALWWLRFDWRACSVQRLPGRLVTTPHTVQSFMARADRQPRRV